MLTGPSDRVSEYGMSMNKMFDYMASGHLRLCPIFRQEMIFFVDNHCGMTIEGKSTGYGRWDTEVCTDGSGRV